MNIILLKEPLTVLASSAENQIDYLKKIGHFELAHTFNEDVSVYEFALMFEDAEYVIQSFINIEVINEIFVSKFKKIEEMLQSISNEGEAGFWTVKGLKTDKRWDEIRFLAKECLEYLDRT